MKRLLLISAVLLLPWLAHGQFLIDPYRFAVSPLNTSLISYWKLDETSGTRVDVGGNGNDLTDNNTVTSNPGIIVNAGQFTLANAEFLSHTDNASLSTGNIDFTFTMWLYFDTKPGGNYAMSKAKTSGSLVEYAVLYANADDRLRFRVSSNGSDLTDVIANNFGSPSTSTWIFLVCWHDATANTINIQINNGTANSGAWTLGVWDSDGDFSIGHLSSGTGYWNGRIDEVGFWKRTLTADEKTALYNSGAGKTCCPFTP